MCVSVLQEMTFKCYPTVLQLHRMSGNSRHSCCDEEHVIGFVSIATIFKVCLSILRKQIK